ncbi:MAG: acyl-CoA dehydrogenase C-terminal domain-containing protein [Myxococcota bacterium]
MNEYRAPLADIRFLLEHVVEIGELSKIPGYEHAEPEVVAGLLEEAAKFMAEVLSPLNRQGDLQGARLVDGVVRSPDGFREAYQKFTAAGWGAVGLDERHGGGGLPYVVATVVEEMIQSANMSFGLCPALGGGAIEALRHHGSEALKATFLTKLVSGEWSATMNLTEPQAGTDLGALRTSAERAEDGNYRIKGTKIFITYGDHDLTDNVIHLVLARTTDAPAGVRGISLFLVPKFLVGPGGEIGERNDLKVVSLEHKLGIHGSPTCVLNFGEDAGGATGYLLGEENRGLQYMFTMMNHERLFVGCQGVAIAERAYQEAAHYARERRQGRAIGSDAVAGESSVIIEHADVRRMLMTMKATIEGMRGLLYDTAATDDLAERHPDAAVRGRSSARVALLTPVVKAWLTDAGVEVTSLAMQVFGGMGYVEETGMPQFYRDVRITPIYEGTNGVQAMDLVSRKLPMEGGAVVAAYLGDIDSLCGELSDAGGALAHSGAQLAAAVVGLREATEWLLERSESDPRSVAAAASPYLRMFGIVAGAYYLMKSALIARRLQESSPDDSFLRNKQATARYYAEQLLPDAVAKLAAVTAGSDSLFEIPAGDF